MYKCEKKLKTTGSFKSWRNGFSKKLSIQKENLELLSYLNTHHKKPEEVNGAFDFSIVEFNSAVEEYLRK